MSELLSALCKIMTALELFPGTDYNLLIALIFVWTICEKTNKFAAGTNRYNRIVRFICNATGREGTVKNLLDKEYDNELFRVEILEESIPQLFPYIMLVPDNLSMIDKLFFLYYTVKNECSWDELPMKVQSWMSEHGIKNEIYSKVLAGINRRPLIYGRRHL